ncbi:MAG: divergent PAP2 family protein [Bavariicoccus seileri]|uniref:Divergent PAP2 family protein n=1 Tax=Bavariicoccus seileri TaxID=549685 RepID=A0A3D4S4M3_9ENTE|nr:divergent PAP2 family protein [Bavariicoccus seileri]HCS93432.1 divergent PAP2 family protein [Bavariicoccus seileri]
MGLLTNFPLICAMSAILIAQLIKFPIAYWIHKRTSLKLLTSTGGMPSSHTAAVASLITSLGLDYGFGSPLVAIATTFGVIVMFDAMGVRRQSGYQGILLRHLVALIEKKSSAKQLPENEDDQQGESLITDESIIDKYLGHEPIEIAGGVVTGIFVAFFIRWLFQIF